MLIFTFTDNLQSQEVILENKTKQEGNMKQTYNKMCPGQNSEVAIIKEPNGFFYLHQGHITDDGLNKMIMRVTTFLASDFDPTNPNGLV